MPNSLLLSEADIIHQSEWAESSELGDSSYTTMPTITRLRLIPKSTEPFEIEEKFLSDRSVGLRKMSWSLLAADAAQSYSRQTVSPWIAYVFDSIQALLLLPEGWDSYEAQPVAIKSIENLIYLLSQGIQLDVPAPSVVPTVSGGIQLEWHRQGIDLEIEIPPSGSPFVSYEDIDSGRKWEGEINLWDNVLSSFLESLSRGRNQPDKRE
jgi:hypothetical protein